MYTSTGQFEEELKVSSRQQDTLKALKNHKLERLKSPTITHMGVSVLSGAFTTATSAFFLLFCEIQIFHRFGVILVVNTFFSLVYTFLFFCALLALIGPVGTVGDVAACCAHVKRYVGVRVEADANRTVLDLGDDADADADDAAGVFRPERGAAMEAGQRRAAAKKHAAVDDDGVPEVVRDNDNDND